MKPVSSAIIPLLLGIFTSTAVSSFPKFGKEKGTIEIGQYNHSAINEPLLNPTQSPIVPFPEDSNENLITSSPTLTGDLTAANSEVNQQILTQEHNTNLNSNVNQNSNYPNEDYEGYRPHFHHHHYHHHHHNHPSNLNQNRHHYHHHLDQSVAGIPLVMVPAIPVMQRPIYPVYHEHHHHSHHQSKENHAIPPPERTPPPHEPTTFEPLPTTTIPPPESTTLLPILPSTPFPTTFPPNPTNSTTPFPQPETTTSSPLTTDFSTKIVPPEPNLTESTTVTFSSSSSLNSSSLVTNATTLPSTLETTTFLPTTPFIPEPTTVATPPPIVVPGFNLTIDALQHYNDTINGLETSLPNILNYEAAQIWPLFGINMHSENVSSKLITGNGTAYQNSLENMASQGAMNIGMNNTMKQFSY